VLERLVHLRLENLTLSGSVTRIELSAERVAVSYRQEELFVSETGSDFEAGDKAIASIRAELGNASVARAVAHDEHLPEERFHFEPLSHLGRAAGSQRSGAQSAPRMVRRIRSAPLDVPPPDAEHIRGPYLLSGHWWRSGGGTRRAYYYVHLPDGRILWVFFDANSGTWRYQGSVD
jgi:hypothetical protein